MVCYTTPVWGARCDWNLQARLNENGYKIIDIYREIKELGYNGGKTQGYNIKLIKENYEIETIGYTELPQPKIPYIKPLCSRKLAKYIGFNLTDITDHHERFYLHTLLNNIAELNIVRKLVQIFQTMLARGCGNIKRWIDVVKRSKYKLAGLKTFARGLSRDIEAVENGINLPWSNGAVEGTLIESRVLNDRCMGGLVLSCCERR